MSGTLSKANTMTTAFTWLLQSRGKKKIVYTVYLEDKKSWKIVRVIDGEMEPMQDLKKSSLKD